MGRRRWAVGALAALLLVGGACGGGGGGGKQDEARSVGQNEKGADGGDDATASKTKLLPGDARPGGKILADSGFRADTNGLPFPNYPNGPGITNLTPADLRDLWGDAVCSAIVDNNCTLTPPGQLVMDELNSVMDGGHCYGLSVLSLMLAKGQDTSGAYGAAKVTELPFDGNTLLQRKLAVGFIGQVLDSVRSEALVGPPNAVLEFLVDYLKDKTTKESYTLGIHLPDGSGGHAVTPYAVVDRGKGKYGVQIYDNNFPGRAREITFDKKKNTWSYFASPNPDEPGALYKGDVLSESMEVFPTLPALGKQPCPFCNGELEAAAAAGQAPLGQVFVSGNDGQHPRIILSDAEGHRTGYVDGKLLKEIPGVRVEHRYYDANGFPAGEPVYRVPLNAALTVTLDGTGLDDAADATVGYIGKGISLEVSDLEFDPGQKDKLTLPGGGSELSYTPGGEQSPTFEVGADFAKTDFAFKVDATDVAKGATFALDVGQDSLGIDTTGKAGAFDVAIRRIDKDGGEELFDHDGLKLASDTSGQLEYGAFEESGDTVTFEVEEQDGTKKEEQLKDEDEDDAKAEPAPEPASSSSTTTTIEGGDKPGATSTTVTTDRDGTDKGGPEPADKSTSTTTATTGKRAPAGSDEPAPAPADESKPPSAGTTEPPASSTTTTEAPPAPEEHPPAGGASAPATSKPSGEPAEAGPPGDQPS